MANINTLAATIKLLLLDIDGVLTNGKLYYSEDGSEMKGFNIKDGLGIKLLQRHNIRVGFITGRKSHLVERRATELGIDILHQGREDKIVVLKKIQSELHLATNEIAYIGDDLPDLAAIRYAGLGIAVADANPAVREHADAVTTNKGGDGAVREACEWILQAQGLWDTVINEYSGDQPL